MVKILIYAYIFHPKKTPNRGVNFKVTAINRNGSIPFHTILGHISNPLTTDRVSRGAYRTDTAGHVVSLYVCRPRMTHCPWARHVPYPLELSGWLGFYSARDKSLVPCGRSLQHFGTQSERQHHRKLVPFVFEPIVCGCRQSLLCTTRRCYAWGGYTSAVRPVRNRCVSGMGFVGRSRNRTQPIPNRSVSFSACYRFASVSYWCAQLAFFGCVLCYLRQQSIEAWEGFSLTFTASGMI